MRDTMREQGGGPLDASTRRLERALSALETRFDRRLKRLEQMEAARGGEGQADRAQLIAELDAARARERALEAIAAEASAALGRAAEEVRAALSDAGSMEADEAPLATVYGEPVTAAGPEADGDVEPPFAPVQAAEGETPSYIDPTGAEEDDGADEFLPHAAKG